MAAYGRSRKVILVRTIMDAGRTLGGRLVDARWTLGGRWSDVRGRLRTFVIVVSVLDIFHNKYYATRSIYVSIKKTMRRQGL